jgi:hypothetical protein
LVQRPDLLQNQRQLVVVIQNSIIHGPDPRKRTAARLTGAVRNPWTGPEEWPRTESTSLSLFVIENSGTIESQKEESNVRFMKSWIEVGRVVDMRESSDSVKFKDDIKIVYFGVYFLIMLIEIGLWVIWTSNIIGKWLKMNERRSVMIEADGQTVKRDFEQVESCIIWF